MGKKIIRIKEYLLINIEVYHMKRKLCGIDINNIFNLLGKKLYINIPKN